MKEKLKNWVVKYHVQIITITLMVVVGTLMHFVTGIFDNEVATKILGVIFPINETTWEHMKMLWYPFMVAGIILAIKKKDSSYFSGFVFGGLISIPMVLGLFAFYQSFTIHSVLILDIIIFLVVMILCALLAFDLVKLPIMKKALVVSIIVALLVTALLITLTYVPGDGYVFLDNSGYEHGH